MPEESFTGHGFAFPFDVNAQGGMRMVTGEANIERAIRLILGTSYGERPMRPEFGCAIHDLIFEPSSLDLLTRIQYEVENSLTRWEPRIDLMGVQARFEGDLDTVMIDIRYVIKGSYDPRNLLVPFYRIPTEEPA